MGETKRALIISYYFAPQNAIGAVRPTKFAKYLTRMGYQVTVLCGAGMNDAVDPTLQRDLEELADVHMLREWNPLRAYKARKGGTASREGGGAAGAVTAAATVADTAAVSAAKQQPNAATAADTATTAAATTATAPAKSAAKQQPNAATVADTTTAAEAVSAAAKPPAPPVARGKGGLMHRLLDTAYLSLWVLSDRSFQRKAIRELRQLTGPYDAVFSTYAPLSVHQVAARAKRMGLARRWIADFRDEVNMSFRWMEPYRRRYMTMLREQADVLCAVSGGFLDMMALGDVGRVLSNGFDREDAAGVLPERAAGDRRFRAVYCGQLREGRKNVPNRDIRPFFRALKRLAEEGECAQDELCLVYAGDEGALFSAYAEECGLAACVENHGRVARDRSLALQTGADVLLMASWNLRGQTGILTGKLFEYMMMDKPIVCCMAGDLRGSELQRVLAETGMGFCHEQAANGEDDPLLYTYLRGLLRQRKAGEPLLAHKNDEEIEKYAYPALTAELAEWMELPSGDEGKGGV